MIHAVTTYDDYMAVRILVPDPVRTEVLDEHVARLGGRWPVTGAITSLIRWCYEQSPGNRVFHLLKVGVDPVAQPELPAPLQALLSPKYLELGPSLMVVAGVLHDPIYMNVDAIDDRGTRALPSVARQVLDPFVDFSHATEDGDPIYRLKLNPHGAQDPVTRMVARLFAVGKEGISHNDGANEFGSALFGAKIMEALEVPAEMIVALTAMIAVTVPFRPGLTGEGATATDGYVGDLVKRFRTAALPATTPASAARARKAIGLAQPSFQLKPWVHALGRQAQRWIGLAGRGDFVPTPAMANDVFRLGVQLSHRDLEHFLTKDFRLLIDGARRLKLEARRVHSSDIHDITTLVIEARRDKGSPLLYRKICGDIYEGVKHTEVANAYIERDDNWELKGIDYVYPPVHVLDAAALAARHNTSLATLFFAAHETGTGFAKAISVLSGRPNAPLPGAVDSKLWQDWAVPAEATPKLLPPNGYLVYKALMFGDGQADVGNAMTVRTPLSGMILGAIGPAKLGILSKEIDQLWEGKRTEDATPYDDPDIAQAYVDKVADMVGDHNFLLMLSQLYIVALHYRDDPERYVPGMIPLLERLSKGRLVGYAGDPIVMETGSRWSKFLRRGNTH